MRERVCVSFARDTVYSQQPLQTHQHQCSGSSSSCEVPFVCFNTIANGVKTTLKERRAEQLHIATVVLCNVQSITSSPPLRRVNAL